MSEETEDPVTAPSATHGEFHKRPGFQPGLEILYCPCEDPMGAPDPGCPVHGDDA
jgi:hypothetical protein